VRSVEAELQEVGSLVWSGTNQAPSNNELQRTSDGTAAGSPLNSVFGGQTGQDADATGR
jgi:hypothetical protein